MPHTGLRVRELSAEQSLRLLATIGFGRIVFSRYALPIIYPVNHLLDAGALFIYTKPGATMSGDRQVVAYQADTLDHHTQLGWCVIMTGTAQEITDQRQLDDYRARLRIAAPFDNRRVIRVHPDSVVGLEYLPSQAHPTPHI
ncbi:pyridoxamine 5'-phosphate oxidase family protein [Nocardia seriolae]|uniref:Pyridoxamine 5'-phosphate oxidase family protein n=1 Tax=Nocardia seriolae TaxID=37332 RepID=A0ABC8AUR0_9NOCA|nr:pyridoxamine 5'-phosphate oxidase family protein [Nocardia seriolae]APA97762.1 uncharacterized protein NS506_03713 [Nocardia seriolae]OJF79792.1 hypothetical protein NS14008_12045 [Nocardia seriolae]QOW36274.1 pyridoxamine 5'-phosphate oxidase family protein [Nocardia seriolae]QUN16219.1 pyridoxamine 5'-phosphate oxidase family protein [Nocardia seriolae]WNJ56727.1 pyridoxamine 5'-phosphate oxidase family protein [Nocardia seriolae]